MLERASVTLHVGGQGVGKTTAMCELARAHMQKKWRVLVVVNRRDDLERFSLLARPALVSSSGEADAAELAGERLLIWTHPRDESIALPDADAAVLWASTHGPLLVCVTEAHLYWRPWPAQLRPTTLRFFTNTRHSSSVVLLDTQALGQLNAVVRDAATQLRVFSQGGKALADLRAAAKPELAAAAEECGRLIATRDQVGWFVEVDPRAPFPPYRLRRF